MHHAALEQTLTSVRIDAGTTTKCTECQTTLGECDPVTICCSHTNQSPAFHLHACYCLSCAPTNFAALSNPPQPDMIVEARLGIAQDCHRHATWLIPVSPTVIDTAQSTHLPTRSTPEQEVHE